ncbi:MAG: hypothetical protein U0X87_15835 [Anaerolineales bacterium]
MENKEPRLVEIELNTIRRAQAGDETAVAQIYDAYVKPIYRYHHSRVGNAVDAEDRQPFHFTHFQQQVQYPFIGLFRRARRADGFDVTIFDFDHWLDG